MINRDRFEKERMNRYRNLACFRAKWPDNLPIINPFRIFFLEFFFFRIRRIIHSFKNRRMNGRTKIYLKSNLI